jgi:GH15 family glucan-1,4-alpha-glucosidase
MPRALVLGNGSLHVNLDESCRLRDVYHPWVGAESHAGMPSFLGFWVDGAFAWFDAFERRVDYEDETLVGDSLGHHGGLGLEVRIRDAVDVESDVLVRQIEINDLAGRTREVRVFLHHDLTLSGGDGGDTVFYDPELSSIVHYRGSRYFLVDGRVDGRNGVQMFTCGRAGFHGFAGTWADAEDGELDAQPIEQGAVDSCAGFRVTLPAGRSATLHAWLCAGTSHRQVVALDAMVRQTGPERLVERTRRYWRSWAATAAPGAARLPPRLRRLYIRSLLTARALCDHDGGVIASTDRDILEHARDTYCYVWPRDAAVTAAALDQAGYPEPLRALLEFCAARLEGGRGYLLHKYLPDGSLGSSWHPWYSDGEAQLPIQEDETALVVWALGEHHRRAGDRELLREMYRRVVEPAADFIASYRDWRTGLPLPGWDLWEERRGVHAFTVAAVWAALDAAAGMAVEFGDDAKGTLYATAASEVRRGADEHLWDPLTGRFARQLVPRPDRSGYDRDLIVDASLWGLLGFGMYPADDPRVVSTMEAVHERLWLRAGVGGVARYQRDYYHCVELSEEVPGNPWVICTLWLADWRVRIARSVAELDETVLPLLEWVERHASAAGLLAEQVDPFSGAPLSVAPLVWSHAAYVDVCLGYCRALARLERSTGAAVETSKSAFG